MLTKTQNEFGWLLSLILFVFTVLKFYDFLLVHVDLIISYQSNCIAITLYSWQVLDTARVCLFVYVYRINIQQCLMFYSAQAVSNDSRKTNRKSMKIECTIERN